MFNFSAVTTTSLTSFNLLPLLDAVMPGMFAALILLITEVKVVPVKVTITLLILSWSFMFTVGLVTVPVISPYTLPILRYLVINPVV